MAHEKTIRFFDMFSGIGGFRAGLEKAGGFSCIGHSEIDKHAERAYRAMHNVKESEAYYEDAREIDTGTMPGFELLTAGFPCQPFSVAGKRKGFNDARGTLFLEAARVARAKRPPYLLLENVPGLLPHDKGRTFAAILHALFELGYHVEWAVLNSKDFGVPQSRRRLYIIGYLDPGCAGKILPAGGQSPEALKLLINGGHQGARVYSPSGLACTLTAGRNPTGLYMVKSASGNKIQNSQPGCRIRRLMPRECLRLQGFTEEQISRLLAVTSDTQAYKQAGNSVTVNVIHTIGVNLQAIHEELTERRSPCRNNTNSSLKSDA